MKTLRAILFVTIIILLHNTSFSENHYSNGGKDLKIYIKKRGIEIGRIMNFNISIISPKNDVSWYYSEKNSGILDSSGHSITAFNCFPTSGNYKLIFEYSFGEDIITDEKSEIEFYLTGEELEIKSRIYIDYSYNASSLMISNFYIDRYYNSSDSVKLIQNWNPSSNGEPEYKIVNKTNRYVLGSGWRNSLWGNIRYYTNGEWRNYSRGGFCGTSMGDKPIPPGDSSISNEGDFIGTPKPFENNRYIYEVYYSFTEAELSSLKWNNPDETLKKVFDYYLLRSEFEIKE